MRMGICFMFRFTIRDVLWLTVVAGVVAFGCGRKFNSKIETARQGAENVEQHAKEIEQASQP
jgi:hypothetical protein